MITSTMTIIMGAMGRLKARRRQEIPCVE